MVLWCPETSLSSRIKLEMKHNFVGKLFANICKAVICHRAASVAMGSEQPFAAWSSNGYYADKAVIERKLDNDSFVKLMWFCG